jgi:hypothetical protein
MPSSSAITGYSIERPTGGIVTRTPPGLLATACAAATGERDADALA